MYKEKWIPGFEGKYKVTTDGQVLSYKKNGNVHNIGRQNGSGYISVNLMDGNGECVQKLVHRLVAEAFLPVIEGKDVVDHIDEDKTNNHVDNLRWCNTKENAEYYHTKDGRRHYLELDKKRKQQLKEMECKLRQRQKEFEKAIKAKDREYKEVEALLAKTQQKLQTVLDELVKEKKAFESYKNKETEKMVHMQKSYQGYKDTTGYKFATVEEMIQTTGKSIRINGTLFPSCGAAAAWIVQEELEKGNIRNKDTVSKELRRYLQGRRTSTTMYEVYKMSI